MRLDRPAVFPAPLGPDAGPQIFRPGHDRRHGEDEEGDDGDKSNKSSCSRRMHAGRGLLLGEKQEAIAAQVTCGSRRLSKWMMTGTETAPAPTARRFPRDRRMK